MAAIERRFGAPLCVVHRRHLLDVLHAAVGDDALRLGSSCTGATQDERTASAVLADGGQLEGDVVVAADGVGSRLREALLSAAAPKGAGLVAWRAVVPANGFDVAAVTGEVWGSGQLFGAARLTQDRLYWFASARAPESPDRSPRAERELLSERFAGWHAPIPAIIESTAPEAVIRTPLREIRRWRHGSAGASRCSATPPTPCCPTWAKAAARRSRTQRALAAALATGAEAPTSRAARSRAAHRPP